MHSDFYENRSDEIISLREEVSRLRRAVDLDEVNTLKKLVLLLLDECDELTGKVEQLEAALPKWISVGEGLPDDLEEVLILVKETEFYGQYKEFSKSYFCQYIGCVDDGEWYTVWCHGHRYIKDTGKEPYSDKLEVTHWMPLPEPPKEG